jgi:hypothetical protein
VESARKPVTLRNAWIQKVSRGGNQTDGTTVNSDS